MTQLKAAQVNAHYEAKDHEHQYTIPVETETTHEVDFIKEGEYREYDQTIVTVLRCQCGEETTR